jgi:hypothetical protein
LIEHHADLPHERIVAHAEAACDREAPVGTGGDEFVDMPFDEVLLVGFVRIGRERRRFVDQTDGAPAPRAG